MAALIVAGYACLRIVGQYGYSAHMPDKSKPSKTKALVALALILIGVVALIYSVLIEPDQLVVVGYPIKLKHWPKQLDGLKIVVLSDLHVGSLHIDAKKLHRIVDESNNQNPDLILMLGDYVASGKQSCLVKPAKFAGELGNLKARLGVYAVLGNHDWWYDGVDVRQCLESAHIKVLEDTSVPLESNGTRFWLTGLGDLWTRKPSIQRALTDVPPDSPDLLMSHNPDVLWAVPQRVSLTLAGHTHGGQVSLPFIGPVITPTESGPRHAKGLVAEDGKAMFVSSGIGTSVLPIRFNVPPEISVLQLNSDANH